MKVAIARALVHDPQTILLDEPTNGLDIMSMRALRDLLRELRSAGKCLLFSSHVMQEVSALCDSIVILGRGRVVATGTAAELVAQSGGPPCSKTRSCACSVPAKGWPRDGRPRAAIPRSSRIAIVARKEIADIVRDRRTMLVTLVHGHRRGSGADAARAEPDRAAGRQGARADAAGRRHRACARA